MKTKIIETVDMLGKKTKKLFNYEKYYLKNLRRSIYFNKNMKRGAFIKKKDLSILRPYNRNGLEIHNIQKIIGKKVKKNFKQFSLVAKN